ncbi:MAG: MBL fold metallo-hydrolase [Acidimicrobiia bacterium]
MLVIPVPAWVAATNSYIVAAERGGMAMIVDAPPEPEVVAAELARHDLTVAALLLTHGHIDHTGGAGALSKGAGAAVYVHPDDDFLTLHPERQLRAMFGMVPPGDYTLPERFEALHDRQMLELGTFTVEVRQTPGHTPGHCCFYLQDHGVLFSGDQLFAGSVGRTDLAGGSWDDLMISMRDRVMTLADEVRVLPGHGPETTIGRERSMNPFRAEWEADPQGSVPDSSR